MFISDAMYLPMAALFNEGLHFQRNTNGIRTDFLRAIHRTFLYERPFVEPPNLSEVGFFFTPGASAPKETLADLRPSERKQVPFWIVNAHLILNEDDDARFRSRSGEAFEITPWRAGSDAVGYVMVPEGCRGLAGPEHFWMSPACAMAISAAAADSESLQQGPGASLGMYLLNLDLGYFIPAWGPGWVRGDPKSSWRGFQWGLTAPFPIHRLLVPLIALVTGEQLSWDRTHEFRTDGRFYGLTDGGHFDNLGLYALVRRGCRLIVVCDASTDSHVNDWASTGPGQRAKSFGELRKAMQLLWADFQVLVEPQWDRFWPSVERIGGPGRGPVFDAYIRNLPFGDPEGSRDIRIVYIKAVLDESPFEPSLLPPIVPEVLADKGFPHRPTFGSLENQLYAEQTFLAYRDLGYRTVLNQKEMFARDGGTGEARGDQRATGDRRATP
jgi:hypothetical protein